MKNRLIVDIYWCALSATWCCKTFTMIHAQNIVIQKIFVRAEGDAAASPASPLDPLLQAGSLFGWRCARSSQRENRNIYIAQYGGR